MNNPSIFISGDSHDFQPVPAVVFPQTALYPQSLMSSYHFEPRRSVSNPLPPSHRSASPSSSQYASPERTALQLLGHRPLDDHDASFVRELVQYHETELRELRARYEKLKGLHARANDRVDVQRKHHKEDSIQSTRTYEVLSAQVTSDLALESRQALEARILAVENSLHKLRGTLHPIRKLPAELLALIMEYAIEFAETERVAAMLQVASGQLQLRGATLFGFDSENSPVTSTFSSHLNKRLSPAVLLSSICTHWRDVAHGLPSLWRTIHFRLTGPANDNRWDRVRSFVDRGKRSPPSAEQLEMVTGLSLVFTGWEEHKYPPVERSFRKVMQMVRKGVVEDDWTLETPSHSRRQSSADTPSNSALGGLTGVPIFVESPTLQVPFSPPSHSFVITRLEIVFNTLCNHHNSLVTGTESNSELHWPSNCPKPREVVMIAKDTVYTTPCNHSGEETRPTHFLIPPFAASLIPRAESVTLVNLQFAWPSIEKPEAYKSLTSLTLVYTLSFDNLLRHPEDGDDLGFLQFLRRCQNLINLEIRLAPRKLGHVVTNGTSNPNGGPVVSPTIWESSLEHLSISLDDLGRISPLICAQLITPSAPIIRFPSLRRLTILPSPPQLKSIKHDKPEAWKEIASRFLLVTEAPIRHLELRSRPQKPHPSHSGAHAGHRLGQEMEALLYVIQEVHGCETLEIWGNDIAQSVLDVVRLSAPQVNGVAEDVSARTSSSEAERGGSLRVGDTAPVSRASPTPSRSEQAPAPGPSSVPPTSFPSRLRRKHASTSPSPTPSNGRKKRISLTEDLVAKVIASILPLKKRSLAIVSTPEGTPRIASNEISIQDDHEITGAAGPVTADSSPRVRVQSLPAGNHPPPRMSTSTSTTAARPSNDTVLHAEPDGMESTAPAVTLPAFKKLIVHDAEVFTAGVAAHLAQRGINTVIYG